MDLGMIITIVALVLTLAAGFLYLNPIRETAKAQMSEEDYNSLMKWTEIAVRWARQWMKTATGEEKKEEVMLFVLKKADQLGLLVDEEDIDKVIEAVYDRIKKEPPLE